MFKSQLNSNVLEKRLNFLVTFSHHKCISNFEYTFVSKSWLGPTSFTYLWILRNKLISSGLAETMSKDFSTYCSR